jgi:hypothetical protein
MSSHCPRYQTLAEGIHSGTVVKSGGLGIALNAQDAHRTAGPTKALWRKREIVKQERIIQYTTVDESGNTQVGRHPMHFVIDQVMCGCRSL